MKGAMLAVCAAAVGALAASPQAGPEPPVIVAVGGGTQNQNDLCWILSRVRPAQGPERMVLALYRAKQGGQFFDLEDVRMIDADLRVVELKKADHLRAGTDVQTILKNLPQKERDAIVPPPK